jgi:hypothetical protein
MRTAFEESHEKNASTGAAVKHACLWIRYAGKTLQKLSSNSHELEEKLGVPGDKYTNRGWKGFSKERWAVWKEGFVSAQTTLSDPETKELCKEAVQRMG